MPDLRSSAAYRIAFTYAAAFAGAILLLGTAVYFAADAEFRRQRDEVIAEELEDLAQEGLDAQLVHEIERREAWRTRQAFSYALFDRSGLPVGGHAGITMPLVGLSTVKRSGGGGGQETLRVKAVTLSDGSRLAVGLDSVAIKAIERTILTLFGVAFILVMATGAIGALVLGWYLTRRLSAVSETVDAIMAGDLDRRVRVSVRRDEFDRVASALNTMLDRIAGLMENLRQVSSDVAHDLRTPLLRLRNELDQVGRVDGAAERAIEQGDHLLRLFGSILRISEVEGGDLQHGFAAVDLSALANDVAESFQPALSDSGHRFAWDVTPGAIVQGDRELLAQALSNLLDNARVHTPQGTRIRLSLTLREGSIRLAVTDNGPGVSDVERPALLRRFYRAEASRTTPGNGLGLSLVAAVAAAHGGRIELEDAGPGLAVIIALPQADR
jgi:signal transduction histidine kinase